MSIVSVVKWMISGKQRRALRDALRQTEAVLEGAPIRKLLVLCHGNIFRSPFVATYLRSLLRDVSIETAGFHPYSGRCSPGSYVERCQTLGIDLSEHCSKVVDREMTTWADAIVIMDVRNWTLLTRLDPAAADKVIWLGIMDGEGVEIMDPYGRSPEEQEQVVARLKVATEALAAELAGR